MALVVGAGEAAGPLVIVTTGGRDLAWRVEAVEAALLTAARGRRVELLLTGGARGADALVGQATRRLRWPLQIVPAKWKLHGRSAGPRRNGQMLQKAMDSAAQAAAAVLLLAFPGGPGTRDCLARARRLQDQGVRVRMVTAGP